MSSVARDTDRRIRVESDVPWQHHRGGWPRAVSEISRALHAVDGVRFLPVVEHTVSSGTLIGEPWVGFVHAVPEQDRAAIDLRRLCKSQLWQKNLENCRGLWVLSNCVRSFLVANGVPVHVDRVHYPAARPRWMFAPSSFFGSPTRRLLFVGEYLRDEQAFYCLDAPGYTKIILRTPDFAEQGKSIQRNDSVVEMSYAPTAQYDTLLATSLVFLQLFDATANTTVVECIARGTPLLVNRVGGIAEYLGDGYPFYYATLDEAARKLKDENLIIETTRYLRRLPLRKILTYAAFLSSLRTSRVYLQLPKRVPLLRS